MVDTIFFGLFDGAEWSQRGFFATVGATVGDGTFDLALHTLGWFGLILLVKWYLWL